MLSCLLPATSYWNAARDKLLENMRLELREGGNRAYYSPSEDYVRMPTVEQFDDTYSYMSVFLHEAAHASGAAHRLNRDLTGSFGSESYAKEELRAEIASAFTASATGINYEQAPQMENHTAYVQNWISVLQNNPNELFRAIKDATKISDYLIEKGEFVITSIGKLRATSISSCIRQGFRIWTITAKAPRILTKSSSVLRNRRQRRSTLC